MKKQPLAHSNLFSLFASMDAQLKSMAATHERIKATYLAEYIQRHRKYPDGYPFRWKGHNVVITCAMADVKAEDVVVIAYGVHRNGEAFDTVPEEEVTNLIT